MRSSRAGLRTQFRTRSRLPGQSVTNGATDTRQRLRTFTRLTSEERESRCLLLNDLLGGRREPFRTSDYRKLYPPDLTHVLT
jgi:hypothetical protein